MTNRRSHCRGFTLIELMVVVAIISSLLALFSIGSRPSRKTQIRNASQSLASLLLTTQTNALNSDLGAALWLSEEGIYNADIPTQDNLVRTVTEIQSTSSGAVANPSDLLTMKAVRVRLSAPPPLHVYRARFISDLASPVAPPSPWLGISQTAGSTADVSFHGSQFVTNTLWPGRFYFAPNNPQCAIEFHQHPVRSTLAEKWPKLASVDLRYSGFGNNVGLAGDVALVFNTTGQPVVLFSGLNASAAASPVTESVYLLIAYADDVANGSDTLTNEDSVWIRLEGETGHITMAWNNPISVPYPPSAAELYSARQNLLQGKGLGR